MLRRSSSLRRISTGALLLALTACSGDAGTEPEVVVLAGNYELISLTQEGGPTISVPLVHGTLTLTDRRYVLEIVVAIPGMEEVLTDQGSYTVDGAQWSQLSDGSDPVTGSYRLQDGFLTVDVPRDGVRVLMMWARTG